MKILFSIVLLFTSIIYSACGNNNNNSKETSVNNDTVLQAADTVNSNEVKSTGTINGVVAGYLNLKNALTNDNGKEAASAANEITATLAKIDESAFSSEQKKVYNEVKDDIKEHAEHI